MGKRGPEPLPVAEKLKRGTLKPARERARGLSVDAHTTSEAVQPAGARDYLAIVFGYVTGVVARRILAGVWVIKACQRFARMVERAQSSESTYVWSPDHVIDVCRFVESCPHVEGKWKSANIRLEPAQAWWLAAIYGFRLRADLARRLVTVVFFVIARKSAKSTLIAALALYHMAKEDEPGAQVICGASTGAQARIVFTIMQKMIRRSLWLRNLGFRAWANAITFKDASARPINAKSSTQDGLNPSLIVLDESHAQDFALHDVLRSAQGARTNPLLLAPTTAGYDLTSVGFALRGTAQKILDGVVESNHTFAVLYEVDEGDDWRDERVWIKSAPMVGLTPTLDYLRRYRDDAIATPGIAGEFQVKVCNLWLHSAAAWLSIAAWDRCADATLTLEQFKGEPCWIGLDLAERDDIAVEALLFERSGIYYAFVRGYLPELVVQERARAVPEYLEFVRCGELITTDGDLTDLARIEEDVRRHCDDFDVQSIVVERFGGLHLTANLSADGLPARLESKNAKTFTQPAREMEARVRARRLRHSGSSFLRWQVSNVRVERRRDGSLLPTKESADSPNKIDAIDAVLLAIGAMLDGSVAAAEPSYQVLIVGGGRR